MKCCNACILLKCTASTGVGIAGVGITGVGKAGVGIAGVGITGVGKAGASPQLLWYAYRNSYAVYRTVLSQ